MDGAYALKQQKYNDTFTLQKTKNNAFSKTESWFS